MEIYRSTIFWFRAVAGSLSTNTETDFSVLCFTVLPNIPRFFFFFYRLPFIYNYVNDLNINRRAIHYSALSSSFSFLFSHLFPRNSLLCCKLPLAPVFYSFVQRGFAIIQLGGKKRPARARVYICTVERKRIYDCK